MTKEQIDVKVNLKEYFSKLDTEDYAAITAMCLDKLCRKAQELKDLYEQLAKAYSFEIGVTNITLLVQVSSPLLPKIPICSLSGTKEGIDYALKEIAKVGAERNG